MDATRLVFFGFGSALIGAAVTVWILLALQPANTETGSDDAGRVFATAIAIVLLATAIYCFAHALFI